MADRLTPEQRHLNMSRVRAKHTAPELIVRKALHARGFRFRLHRRDLPGSPDIVLSRYRAAVLVHGCFWHGHDCPLFKMPATRPEFWNAKIEANRSRDTKARMHLYELGWRSVRVWECALKGKGRLDPSQMIERLANFLLGPESEGDIAGLFGANQAEAVSVRNSTEVWPLIGIGS